LLPLLSRSFGASPAAASLAMSAGTFALALAIIPVSSLSEVRGRREVMTVSVLAAAVLGLVAPLSPSLPVLIGIRVLQGFALAGVPATAMAYLAEEVDQADLGRAMGVYIAGNAIGGLSGRINPGVLGDGGRPGRRRRGHGRVHRRQRHRRPQRADHRRRPRRARRLAGRHRRGVGA